MAGDHLMKRIQSGYRYISPLAALMVATITTIKANIPIAASRKIPMIITIRIKAAKKYIIRLNFFAEIYD
jgi:hypothetical protein